MKNRLVIIGGRHHGWTFSNTTSKKVSIPIDDGTGQFGQCTYDRRVLRWLKNDEQIIVYAPLNEPIDQEWLKANEFTVEC